MNKSIDAEKAKKYYTDSFAREDYYTEGQEITGLWGGKAAAMLGLSGNVDQPSFAALCENRHPVHPEQRLTPRTRDDRTVGYDLTFDVPKSVSLVHAFAGDRRILEVFREAVAETMGQVEKMAATRVRKGMEHDADENRLTENLVWAEFVHFTARPVGGLPDPQLHAHMFVFNSTWDPVEERWKAGQFRMMKEKMPYFQAAFHNRLAKKLEELGYQIDRRGKAFEIVGVPESAIRKFSRRTQQIEQLAKELGITSDEVKAQLGALTREHKRSDIPLVELWEQARKRMTPEEARVFEVFKQRRGGDKHREQPSLEPTPRGPSSRELGTKSEISGVFQVGAGKVTEAEAIDYAIMHHFGRESVIPESTLLATALAYGVGRVDEGKLAEEFGRRRETGKVVTKDYRGRSMATTAEVIAEERFILGWIKQRAEPLAPRYRVQDKRLNEEQRTAIDHILNSRDRVIGVIGKSGTGKTTLMHEAMEGLQSALRQVQVLTPHSEHAYQRLRDEGFSNTVTVEKFLKDQKLQEKFRDEVLWVDEAGLLSSRAMYRLFKAAEEINARVIISGDPGQHGPVERGDAMRLLAEQGQLPMARLDTILRQQGLYKEAVEHLANGKIAEAFDKLNAMGAIHEIDSDERFKVLATDYLKWVEAGDRPLVISPTHFECRKVTEEIRIQCKATGQLQDEEMISILRKVDLQEAQRGDWRNYKSGWIIELSQNIKGHNKGQRLEIVGVGNPEARGFLIKDESGVVKPFELQKWEDRFNVFEEDAIPIASGERIRITQNGKDARGKKLHNSTLHTVLGFTSGGHLKLENGAILPKEYAHFNHGYANTSHVSQGKTVNRVLISEGTESLMVVTRQLQYVAVGRAKIRPDIYTNDLPGLIEAAHVSSDRLSAVELLDGKKEDSAPPREPGDNSKQAQVREEQQPAEQHKKLPTPQAGNFSVPPPATTPAPKPWVVEPAPPELKKLFGRSTSKPLPAKLQKAAEDVHRDVEQKPRHEAEREPQRHGEREPDREEELEH